MEVASTSMAVAVVASTTNIKTKNGKAHAPAPAPAGSRSEAEPEATEPHGEEARASTRKCNEKNGKVKHGGQKRTTQEQKQWPGTAWQR